MNRDPLILVANPGSASRKYAIFEGQKRRADLHFEHFKGRIIATYSDKDSSKQLNTDFTDMQEAASWVMTLFRRHNTIQEDDVIDRVGLRLVAPGAYFLKNHLVDDETLDHLRRLNRRSPIHTGATLDELERLQMQFTDTPIIGISDSAFHITKPDHAWNYGIPLEDADRFDIKRFGYHGLSAESVVEQLQESSSLPSKLIIAHLGNGTSITAVKDGKSIDHSMGYSSFEGALMATRSGDIDLAATQALKHIFQYDDASLNTYLNLHSGLLGLGGNSDIRELLRREEDGDHRSHLALSTYLYSVRKSIGQMAAALGGVDGLVLTGTVGERSAEIRGRLVSNLSYLGLSLDESKNANYTKSDKPASISSSTSTGSVFVVSSHENTQVAKHTIRYSL